MKQDEAEKLARYVQEIIWKAFSRDTFHDDVEKLCDFILSGDHKREIENAAFERAARTLDEAAQEFNLIRDPGMANHCRAKAKAIRTLITPAQTADTEE